MQEQARELLLEMGIQDAIRRRSVASLEDGIRSREMEGFRRRRRDGTEGSRVMWEPGHKRPQSAKNQQAKAEKAARKQGAATSATTSVQTQTHIRPPEGENSSEEPIVPQGPEWVESRYEDRTPLVGTVIEAAWSGVFLILTLLETHHRSGYVHLRWITHPYDGQSQQSHSSRHSRGRARTGSDSTTSRERKPDPGK